MHTPELNTLTFCLPAPMYVFISPGIDTILMLSSLNNLLTHHACPSSHPLSPPSRHLCHHHPHTDSAYSSISPCPQHASHNSLAQSQRPIVSINQQPTPTHRLENHNTPNPVYLHVPNQASKKSQLPHFNTFMSSPSQSRSVRTAPIFAYAANLRAIFANSTFAHA